MVSGAFGPKLLPLISTLEFFFFEICGCEGFCVGGWLLAVFGSVGKWYDVISEVGVIVTAEVTLIAVVGLDTSEIQQIFHLKKSLKIDEKV